LFPRKIRVQYQKNAAQLLRTLHSTYMCLL